MICLVLSMQTPNRNRCLLLVAEEIVCRKCCNHTHDEVIGIAPGVVADMHNCGIHETKSEQRQAERIWKNFNWKNTCFWSSMKWS